MRLILETSRFVPAKLGGRRPVHLTIIDSPSYHSNKAQCIKTYDPGGVITSGLVSKVFEVLIASYYNYWNVNWAIEIGTLSTWNLFYLTKFY